MGCGYESEFSGKATASFNDPLNHLNICPQWLWREVPVVRYVLLRLNDFEKGRMGIIDEMDADLVDLFTAARLENDKWLSEMKYLVEKQAMSKRTT